MREWLSTTTNLPIRVVHMTGDEEETIVLVIEFVVNMNRFFSISRWLVYCTLFFFFLFILVLMTHFSFVSHILVDSAR